LLLLQLDSLERLSVLFLVLVQLLWDQFTSLQLH
jgi:hypothetical protein